MLTFFVFLNKYLHSHAAMSMTLTLTFVHLFIIQNNNKKQGNITGFEGLVGPEWKRWSGVGTSLVLSRDRVVLFSVPSGRFVASEKPYKRVVGWWSEPCLSFVSVRTHIGHFLWSTSMKGTKYRRRLVCIQRLDPDSNDCYDNCTRAVLKLVWTPQNEDSGAENVPRASC